MTEDLNDKSIRILSFSGKRDDWTMWSKKFLATAHRSKYKKVLKGATVIPDAADTFDATTAVPLVPKTNLAVSFAPGGVPPLQLLPPFQL